MPINKIPKVKIINENPNFKRMKSLGKLSLVFMIITLFLIFDGFYIVPAGHAGVIFDNGRGVLEKSKGEGLHVKIPVWQRVTIYDTRTQEYTMSIAAGEGYKYESDAIEARSKDGQVVWVDATVLFHIDADEASTIKQRIGSEYDVVQKVVRPKTREVVREIVGRFNALDLVSEKRSEIADSMNTDLTNAFGTHFVTLEQLIVRNVTFSAEFAAAIEQKEVARQNVITAQYRKEEARELKEKKIIEAEAEAEAIRLKGEVLRANPEVIQLEFVQKMAKDINWGVLPDNIVPLMNVGQ